MEDNIAVKQSFEEAIDTLKQADNDVNSYVRDIYKSMIKYYTQAGEGAISKYAGVIITQNLINVFIKRFLELGGKYEDIIEKTENV